MIAWLATRTGLSILAVKLILLAVASGGILYGLRIWGNKQWAKGEAAGRLYEAKAIEKQKQAEWKIKETAIAADAANVAAEKRSVRAAADQLAQDRITIGRTLKDALAGQAAQRNRDYATTANVPDDLLDGAIRTVSRQLAAAP